MKALDLASYSHAALFPTFCFATIFLYPTKYQKEKNVFFSLLCSIMNCYDFSRLFSFQYELVHVISRIRSQDRTKRGWCITKAAVIKIFAKQ